MASSGSYGRIFLVFSLRAVGRDTHCEHAGALLPVISHASRRVGTFRQRDRAGRPRRCALGPYISLKPQHTSCRYLSSGIYQVEWHLSVAAVLYLKLAS
jgi:hypothetical protein